MRLSAVVTPFVAVCTAFFPLLTPLSAAEPTTKPKAREFVLILDEQPVSVKFAHTAQRNGFAAQSWRTQIRSAQARVRQQLSGMKVPVTGSADTFLNGVFVTADMDQVPALRAIPGVSTVVIAPRLHRTLDRALDLQNVKQAWTGVGGVGKAGAGVKIGIIDSGLDQTHPGLQDTSLPVPDGFPKGDANFTNNKVIAARSYVSMLSSSDPTYSTPDDNSPRDHIGHGTALAMIAAGNTVKAPVAQITGVAPKAYLGNYKIFGSPGVNDFTSTAVLVQALEDAFNDGMDIAVLSLGYPAFNAPLDMSTGCQSTPLRSYIPATVCDVNAYVVEHAALIGMVVVVAAGNDGCVGLNCPTLGTINSPGTAPSAITV
ncbi:MAG: minor extracellular serine protease Vpr, partial [Bryobacterales bacterium]|nr:minor extracellular serine protease Vpr [Bryobacterales bacterium]